MKNNNKIKKFAYKSTVAGLCIYDIAFFAGVGFAPIVLATTVGIIGVCTLTEKDDPKDNIKIKK